MPKVILAVAKITILSLVKGLMLGGTTGGRKNFSSVNSANYHCKSHVKQVEYFSSVMPESLNKLFFNMTVQVCDIFCSLCFSSCLNTNFSIITKNHLADSERFLHLRQIIYERVKECHERGSNSRELADQPRDLTTKPTVLDRRCELL